MLIKQRFYKNKIKKNTAANPATGQIWTSVTSKHRAQSRFFIYISPGFNHKTNTWLHQHHHYCLNIGPLREPGTYQLASEPPGPSYFFPHPQCWGSRYAQSCLAFTWYWQPCLCSESFALWAVSPTQHSEYNVNLRPLIMIWCIISEILGVRSASPHDNIWHNN